MKPRELVKDKVVKEKEENFIVKGVKFLKEVKIEAKKITWPPKKQVLLSALMIMFFSIVIGAYLGLLDIIYNALISFLVR
uniref:Protein translocase subunit SecE n=1 Tax=Thermodesulfobacterium geofontis TaxID=1295609 RepID=A0A7V4JPZ9_9BACT